MPWDGFAKHKGAQILACSSTQKLKCLSWQHRHWGRLVSNMVADDSSEWQEVTAPVDLIEARGWVKNVEYNVVSMQERTHTYVPLEAIFCQLRSQMAKMASTLVPEYDNKIHGHRREEEEETLLPKTLGV